MYLIVKRSICIKISYDLRGPKRWSPIQKKTMMHVPDLKAKHMNQNKIYMILKVLSVALLSNTMLFNACT